MTSHILWKILSHILWKINENNTHLKPPTNIYIYIYIYISYQSCTHSIRVPSFGVLPSQHALSGNKVKAHKRRRTIGERISCGFPVSMDGLKGISGKFLTSNIVSCKLFVEQSPAWSEMVQPILARATNRLWYGWTMTSVAFNKPKKTLEEYPGSYFHRNMGISLAT